jgi:hypothetical protein
MSSDEVTRALRTTGTKPFPRSGTFTPRVGSRHVSAGETSPRTRAKYARSRSGMCFELTLSASWKKVSR